MTPSWKTPRVRAVRQAAEIFSRRNSWPAAAAGAVAGRASGCYLPLKWITPSTLAPLRRIYTPGHSSRPWEQASSGCCTSRSRRASGSAWWKPIRPGRPNGCSRLTFWEPSFRSRGVSSGHCLPASGRTAPGTFIPEHLRVTSNRRSRSTPPCGQRDTIKTCRRCGAHGNGSWLTVACARCASSRATGWR